MKDEDFIRAGYTKYPPASHHGECCTALFQKCIRDEEGAKKYFISVNKWDFSRYEQHIGDLNNPRYEYVVQFTHKNGETVDVTCYSGWEIDEAEAYYEDLWNTGCYELYERIY